MTAIKSADAFFNDRAMNTVAGLEFVLGACETYVLTLVKYLPLMAPAMPLQFRGQHIKIIAPHV